MVTIRIAKQKIIELVSDLRNQGFEPSRAVLFGSVAKQKAHQWSDIDVAIWDRGFIGCAPFDYEPILKILRKYPGLELHTFNSSETASSNPFIEEIEKHGIEIEISSHSLPKIEEP